VQARKYIKIGQVDFAFSAEIFQGIGSHRTCIDPSVAHRNHDPVVGFGEAEYFEVSVWIDPYFFEFSPGHEPSAQGGFRNRHEGFSFEIVEATDIFSIAAAKNNAAVAVVHTVDTLLFNRCNAIDLIPVLESHINRRIGQDKIHISVLHAGIDLVMVQRYDDKAPAGNLPGEIISRGRPAGQTLLLASDGKHADFNGRVFGP